MNAHRIIAFYQERMVSKSKKEVDELRQLHPAEDSRSRNFVFVQVKNRQDRATPGRINELVRVPARCQRACFGFAVSDNAEGKQIRVIENCSVRVHQGVPQLATFINRTRNIGSHMTGYAARKRKLLKEAAQALFVLSN